MASFAAGLFVGGDTRPCLQDNLDLERWFRKPKGHERHIHGQRHAGVRIVQEGPTLLLALDAHGTHPEPFTAHDLGPYQDASVPPRPVEALQRRKIMRKARSKKTKALTRRLGTSVLECFLAFYRLVVDNAPWHRGVSVEHVLEVYPHLRLYRLPSYSPQLNVIERFWRVLRRRATPNRLFMSRASLRATLRSNISYF